MHPNSTPKNYENAAGTFQHASKDILVNDPTTQLVGQVIGDRYKVTGVIGRGGFGLVYKAQQLSTHQIVAIKVMQPELLAKSTAPNAIDIQRERFKREMRLISHLKHPNIVHLVDSGELDDGQLFLVLAFIDGEPLHEVLRKEGPLAIKEVCHLMFQILDALSSAHALGIVHRDLKPDNIMLVRSGYRRNAVILDFGIAAILKEAQEESYLTLTQAGTINGTPAYMAPEQFSNESPTAQSDLYAWGLLFIEALTGERVLAPGSLIKTALAQSSKTDLEVPESIKTPGLRAILETAIKKDLTLRYPNAPRALEDLEALDLSQAPKFVQTPLSISETAAQPSIKEEPQDFALMETCASMPIHSSSISDRDTLESVKDPQIQDTLDHIEAINLGQIPAKIKNSGAYGKTYDINSPELAEILSNSPVNIPSFKTLKPAPTNIPNTSHNIPKLDPNSTNPEAQTPTQRAHSEPSTTPTPTTLTPEEIAHQNFQKRLILSIGALVLMTIGLFAWFLSKY